MEIWPKSESNNHEIQMFYIIIWGNFSDFASSYGKDFVSVSDYTKAIWNLTLSLYHFREHSADQKSVDEIIKDCPAYAELRDVATAAKHTEISKSKSTIRSITLSPVAQIYSDPLNETARVQITNPLTGSKKSLEQVIISVIEYWIDELNRRHNNNLSVEKILNSLLDSGQIKSDHPLFALPKKSPIDSES